MLIWDISQIRYLHWGPMCCLCTFKTLVWNRRNSNLQFVLHTYLPCPHLFIGSLHCVACTDTGEVYTWGDNDEGQLGDGTTLAAQRPRLLMALQVWYFVTGIMKWVFLLFFWSGRLDTVDVCISCSVLNEQINIQKPYIWKHKLLSFSQL